MSNIQLPTTSDFRLDAHKAVRKAYLSGVIDVGGYHPNGQPLFQYSHRRFRIHVSLARHLKFYALRALGIRSVVYGGDNVYEPAPTHLYTGPLPPCISSSSEMRQSRNTASKPFVSCCRATSEASTSATTRRWASKLNA
jgi:hypothetical protein